MIKNIKRLIDLNNDQLVIQKYNIEDKTLYCKSRSGLEEWYTFKDINVSDSNVLEGHIETYKNSSGFECKFEYKNDDKFIVYTDNLGNYYEDYSGDIHERRYKNGLEYSLDENGNLIYYKSMDGYEDKYIYDSNNLIRIYSRIKEETGEFYRAEYDRNTNDKTTKVKETIFKDNDSITTYRIYDEYGREILYYDNNDIKAETVYENDTAITTVYNLGKFLFKYECDSDSYGKGFSQDYISK